MKEANDDEAEEGKGASTKIRKAKTRRASTPKSKRPDGSISSGIYDQVEKLVADGKMTRTAAFKHIAKESGRKEGTVSVNYYYAAKKRGKTGRRATKKAAKPAATASKAGGSISGMIYDAIEKLVTGSAMTRAAAFRQHAKATGRKEGTVAVNYLCGEEAGDEAGADWDWTVEGRATDACRGGSASNVESVFKPITDLIRHEGPQPREKMAHSLIPTHLSGTNNPYQQPNHATDAETDQDSRLPASPTGPRRTTTHVQGPLQTFRLGIHGDSTRPPASIV